jgi:hypothetical protein
MADQNLDVGAYLAGLKAERARLDIVIAHIESTLGLTPSDTSYAGMGATGAMGMPSTGREAAGKVRSDEFFRMSIPEAVRRYLEIMKAPQSPTAIVGALKAGGVLSESKNFYTTVWTALKRLRKAGDIVNTRTGWGLSDWYPNKPKGAVEDKKGKRGKQKKGRKAASKAPQAPKEPVATTASGPKATGTYQAFVAAQRKAGKNLKEIGVAWQASKGGSPK